MPALDRVNGDITTLFFSNSPSISNGLNNAQGAFFEIDSTVGSPSIVIAPGTTFFLSCGFSRIGTCHKRWRLVSEEATRSFMHVLLFMQLALPPLLPVCAEKAAPIGGDESARE